MGVHVPQVANSHPTNLALERYFGLLIIYLPRAPQILAYTNRNSRNFRASVDGGPKLYSTIRFITLAHISAVLRMGLAD